MSKDTINLLLLNVIIYIYLIGDWIPYVQILLITLLPPWPLEGFDGIQSI